MNKIKLLALADIIEKDRRLGFDLSTWARVSAVDGYYPSYPTNTPLELHDCGTTGCIAGHAVFTFGYKDPKCKNETIERAARRILGLTNKQANFLFLGKWHPKFKRLSTPPNATRKEAAEAIRKFVKRNGKPWGPYAN